MPWVQTVNEKYCKSGLKGPVFLEKNNGRNRIFVDVPEGLSVNLFYSFDPKPQNLKGKHSMEWHPYEAGRFEGDFAFEMLSVSAVRLHVLEKSPQENAVVELHIYQQKTEDEK